MAKVTIPATHRPVPRRSRSARGGGTGRAAASASRTSSRPTANTASTSRKKITSTWACIRAVRRPRPRWSILVDGVEVVRKDIGGTEFLDLADRDGAGRPQEDPVEKVSSSGPGHGRPARRHADLHRARPVAEQRRDGRQRVRRGRRRHGPGRVSDMPIIQTGDRDRRSVPAAAALAERQPREDLRLPAEDGRRRARPAPKSIARNLGTRAFRRPVTDADVKLLMKFYDLGREEAGGFDAGVTELVTAVLSSPDFLYRAISAPRPRPMSRGCSPTSNWPRACRSSCGARVPTSELIDLAADRQAVRSRR